MRLGAPVEGWRNAEEWAALHVRRGYGAAYWPLGLEATEAEEQAFVEAAAKHDLVIAEVGVWNNPLAADPDERERNVRYAIARLKQADRVGARCCVNISGSCGAQWDGPHPDNLTEKTFERVVQCTRRILDEAAPTRTDYTLENMPWMVPTDAADMRRLLEAVDRPHFAVHVDMCNMVNSYDKVYRTGELTRAFFGEFGALIRSVHAKDTSIGQECNTLHILEVSPCTGFFDYEALLSECAKRPDLPVMAEHLHTQEEYIAATNAIADKAVQYGLTFVKAK